MDRTQDYMVGSLELHLFFARIMKEHAFFLKAGFLPPNAALARESERLMREFEALLARAITLSNCTLRRCVLDAGEFFTEFTDCAEQKTQCLTGIPIDRELTARTEKLESCRGEGGPRVSQQLLCQVRQLNREGLQLVNAIIAFKERLLSQVDSCRVFTANYPLLIRHILREARLYREHLMRLEGMSRCSREELRDSELFWNQIMMEHALFIRGLLDPGEEALVDKHKRYQHDAGIIAVVAVADGNIAKSAAANDAAMCRGNTLALTRKFRDFKRAGVEGIEACKIRSIILPLLADHVLREANHYIRLLEA